MITFKYGTMNSGKTLNLLQLEYNYISNGLETYIMKPKIDTKGNDEIISRIGISKKVDYLIEKDDNLFVLMLGKFGYNLPGVIFIDEIQFLTKEQIDQLIRLSVLLGANIICYGLRTDFRLQPFESSSYLFSFADKIEELESICKCGQKTTLNIRFKNGTIQKDGDQILIDDNTDGIQYEAMCHNCYYELIGEII